jgi:hypothetical protein
MSLSRSLCLRHNITIGFKNLAMRWLTAFHVKTASRIEIIGLIC